jgi:hypothetical protein
MFLIKLVWFLVTLPIRLALFALGLAFWFLTLPLRIVFGALGLIGLGRIAQLTIGGAVGYFFYKLVNPDPEDLLPPAPTQADLNKYPST